MGAARAAGMAEVLRLTTGTCPAAVWLATTDADTVVPPHWLRRQLGDGPHPHLHGANLGIRASAYLAVGGFRALPTAEDHALLGAVTEAGYAVLRASDLTVQTSARRLARAPHGFSHLLRTLAEQRGVSRPARVGGALRYDVKELSHGRNDASLPDPRS